MGLFGKKKPVEYCAICGKERKTGLLRGLFQTEIEGQYVCSECVSGTDIQQEIYNTITMDQFRAYLTFREENQRLKEQFAVTAKIDFGSWDTKVVFDQNNGLMCLDENLSKTVFQRGELKSFVIREDDVVIFEGGEAGLACYNSNVPNLVRMMEPEFNEFRRRRIDFDNRLLRMSVEERNQERSNRPRFTRAEPFDRFYVELYFEHPYWNRISLDLQGPRFHDTEPDAASYLAGYRSGYAVMENLANELMLFGFPAAGMPAEAAAVSSQTDAAEALLRFKELLDMGVLTQEEFDAKKKQLLAL